jgi:uncharacterized protein (TIGR03435 family)
MFDLYDISAKLPEGSTSDQIPEMLQQLLHDRFQCVAHMEEQLKNGYSMVVEERLLKHYQVKPGTETSDNLQMPKGSITPFGLKHRWNISPRHSLESSMLPSS